MQKLNKNEYDYFKRHQEDEYAECDKEITDHILYYLNVECKMTINDKVKLLKLCLLRIRKIPIMYEDDDENYLFM